MRARGKVQNAERLPSGIRRQLSLSMTYRGILKRSLFRFTDKKSLPREKSDGLQLLVLASPPRRFGSTGVETGAGTGSLAYSVCLRFVKLSENFCGLTPLHGYGKVTFSLFSPSAESARRSSEGGPFERKRAPKLISCSGNAHITYLSKEKARWIGPQPRATPETALTVGKESTDSGAGAMTRGGTGLGRGAPQSSPVYLLASAWGKYLQRQDPQTLPALPISQQVNIPGPSE